MSGGVERAASIVLWALSVWSFWRWWLRRLAEPIDADVAAWAAFVLFVFALWRRAGNAAWRRPLPAWKWWSAAAFLLAYHVLDGILPPTASGVFAVLAGVPLLLPEEEGRGPVPLPLVALALLGLPSAMIVDFFIGFPLRVVATHLSAWLLGAAGWEVAVEGVGLSLGGVAVWVDAPCAGVRMLGAGLVLAFALAQVFRLGVGRTVALAVLAGTSVVAANVARVTALTVCEVNAFHLSPAAHAALGCLSLFFGAAACAFAAYLLADGRRRR